MDLMRSVFYDLKRRLMDLNRTLIDLKRSYNMDLKGPPLVDLIKSQYVSKEPYTRPEEVNYGSKNASYGPE